MPGGNGSAEAAGNGNSLPGRLHQLQRQAGDATQLVDGAATRYRHQRPRIVRVERREIGGCLDAQPGELRRRGSTDAPDLIDGHRGQQFGLHLTGTQIADARILRTLLRDELATLASVFVGAMPTLRLPDYSCSPIEDITLPRCALAIQKVLPETGGGDNSNP